jgi:type I restriction enzyme S subunit
MKAGWETKPLGEVCEITKGRKPKLKMEQTDSDLPYLVAKVLRGSQAPEFASSADRNSILVSEADTIIICDGSNSGEVFTGFSGILSSTMGKLAVNTDIDGAYLRAFLDSTFDLFNGSKTGSAIPHLDKDAFYALPFSYPPLPEQRRIVAILDEAFAAIATARAHTEKNLQNARELFESQLEAVFSQRGQGWVETTLDAIATNCDSQRIPITKSKRESGKFPYYGASGIVDHVANYIFDGDYLLVSEDGANLLARSTPIAFPVSGKFWVNNHAHILKFENPTTQQYVEFYLESIQLDAFITGAAQPKLNQKALNSIPIPIPSITQQQAAIVEIIANLRDQTQHLESHYRAKLAALDEIKQSLLQQAFSGAL